MKNKIAALLVCIAMCGCLFACGTKPGKQDLNDNTTVTQPSVDYEAPDNETPEVPDNETPQAGEGETPENPGGTVTTPPAVEQPPENPEVPPAEEPPAAEEPPVIEQPPAVRYDTLIASTTNGLNVRSGPGTGYSIIGSMDKNDMAQPLGLSDGWYKIRYNNQTGYVSAKYITTVNFNKADEVIENVIAQGKMLLGIPYVYGAQRYHLGNGKLNPDYDGKSYDCSSLMQYIFKKGANVNLAMTSREQSLQGTTVAKADIKRGDLLFFTNASRKDKTGLERIGHVALYLGDNIILHTASDHAVIEPITATRDSYFITAKRFF